MKNAFGKNIFRTIKKSMGRYMAIFAIIALGVGFFTGLKASKPAMMKTGQEYVQAQKLYDYRLVSTWGFDAQEVTAIQELAGVSGAQGSVWEDFIYVNPDGIEACVKAISITDQVNQLTVTAGRLPEAANECVLDAYVYSEDMIGQEIAISAINSQETRDSFAYESYIVTGLVRTPIYMNMERGTTTIGSGKIDGFLFLPLEGFSYDYFKEVYIKSDNQEVAFTDAYQEAVDANADSLEADVLSIIEARYLEEIADAREKIADGQQELADGEQEIADGEQELLEGRQELAQETQKAQAELLDAKIQLEEGEQQLLQAEAQLQEARATLAQKQQELIDGEESLAAGEALYQQGLEQYQQGMAQYQTALAEYEAGLALVGTPQEALISLEQLAAAQQQLTQTKAQLDAAESQLTASRRELNAAKTALDDGKIQLAQGQAEIEQGQQELDASKQEIADGWAEYRQGETEFAEKTQEAQEELDQGEQELLEAQEEVAEAKQELLDAQEELAEVEEPKLYVLDRSTNAGYASYESDVSIVEGIAQVFPLFFFLIAALVCSTTMTRMVDDERTQIGTLRALGYSEGNILFKYMIYSGSAAGLGACAGYFLGTRLFPAAIWTAYSMLYGFAPITLVDSLGLFAISLVVALLCSAGTTYAACRVELSHAPAQLIRPKAPSAGKRILLERVTFLWKHLKFLHKVSARNIFRFKKRMLMMILGIAGCTALVVAGFGVKDSISNIVNIQYDNILIYDISATYSKEISESAMEDIQQQFDRDISSSALLQQTTVEAVAKQGNKAVTLMVSEGEDISHCIDFHWKGNAVDMPQKGEILIDNRLAEVLSAEVGDEITLMSGETESKPLKIAGIFENYTFYYAYVSGETYEEYFQEDYQQDTLYVCLKEDADHYQIASYLSDMKNAANINVIADMRVRVENTMQSINYIVVLIIGCAAALAFIVLFNLGNINISERVREIATLKVLGFYPRETGSYVFRESAVLSVLGILVGLPLGVLLHRFIMLQIKIDMVSFEISIKPLSYLYSVVTVLCFTIFVDIIMRRKINGINMAESLKSIE